MTTASRSIQHHATSLIGTKAAASDFAGRAAEASWLTALLVTPVLFSVDAYTSFELGRILLVRFLALLILTAWLVCVFAARPITTDDLPGTLRCALALLPFLPAVIILLAVTGLATIVSVSPSLSFWGDSVRLQGFVTEASYVVLFAATLVGLRRRGQLDRLVSIVLMASVPVSLYAVVQMLKLDPLASWVSGRTFQAGRVTSTVGHPVFLAGLLAMVIPLTVGGLLAHIPAARSGRTLAARATVALYAGLLVLQLAALYATQSRGPWLATAAGCFFLLFWLALLRRRQRVAQGLVAIVMIAAAFVALLNVASGPLAPLRQIPGLSRLSNLLESTETGQQRLLIWQGTVAMLAAHPERLMIGFGPETMGLVYGPFYPPALASYELDRLGRPPDRAHNKTFDLLVGTGLLGAITYQALIILLIGSILAWAGLVRGTRLRQLLAAMIGLGVAFGFASLALRRDGALLGLAVTAGVLTGMVMYLLTVTVPSEHRAAGRLEEDGSRLAVLSLLAAVLAHVVETQFSFDVTPTATYFYVFLGALAAVMWSTPSLARPVSARQSACRGRGRSHDRAVLPFSTWEEEESRPASPWIAAIAPAGLMGLLMATLGSELWLSPQVRIGPGFMAAVWIIAVAIVLLPAGGWLLWPAGGAPPKPLPALAPFAVISSGLTIIGVMVSVAVRSRVSDPVAPAAVYSVTLLAAIVILGLSMIGRRVIARMPSVSLAVITMSGAIVVAFTMGMASQIQADIYRKQVEAALSSGRPALALDWYELALRQTPTNDRYWGDRGVLELKLATQQDEQEQQISLLQQATQDLMKARTLQPLRWQYPLQLTRVYRTWASVEGQGSQRLAHLTQAQMMAQAAWRLNPNSIETQNEVGLTLLASGRAREAKDQFLRTLAQDPDYMNTYRYLAHAYESLGDIAQQEATYKAGLNRRPTWVGGYVDLGNVYASHDRVAEAIAVTEQALALDPQNVAALANLADMYRMGGRRADALVVAQRAAALAITPLERNRLDELVRELDGEKKGE